MKMIKFIKLTTGDEFVAQVELVERVPPTETTEPVAAKIKVTNPIRIGLAPDGNAGAVPFLPFCKGPTHEFDMKYVMLMDDVEESIDNFYKQQFGIGILLPPTQKFKISE